MASGCPINNLIPEWNDLVYRGQWREALDAPAQDQQLPRVHRARLPGAVRGLVRAGHQRARRSRSRASRRRSSTRASRRAGSSPSRPQTRTGKKVAVVGSGPAGLACRRSSSTGPATRVTVFERADRIGGLLMYGIPNMKLDKSVVERRVELMARGGRQVRHRRLRSARTYPTDEAAGGVRRHRALRRRDRGARPAGRGPRA